MSSVLKIAVISGGDGVSFGGPNVIFHACCAHFVTLGGHRSIQIHFGTQEQRRWDSGLVFLVISDLFRNHILTVFGGFVNAMVPSSASSLTGGLCCELVHVLLVLTSSNVSKRYSVLNVGSVLMVVVI